MIATRSAMNPIYLQTNASLDMIFDIFKFDVQKNLNLIKGPNSGLSPAAIHILTSPIKYC